MNLDDEGNDHAPASAEEFITSLFAKAGWETPGKHDAAGVLAFRHPCIEISQGHLDVLTLYLGEVHYCRSGVPKRRLPVSVPPLPTYELWESRAK